MEKISYQEPCCIERTLPQLLRKYGWLPWQTAGDVTIEKVMKAVSHLAGNSLDITLATPEMDVPMLRLFNWYHQRGWLRKLTILTKEDQTESIRKELSAELDLTITNSTTLSPNSGLLVIKGEVQTVVVSGPLYSSAVPYHLSYTSYCGKDQDRIDQLTATTLSRIRVAVATAKRKVSKKTAKKTAAPEEKE